MAYDFVIQYRYVTDEAGLSENTVAGEGETTDTNHEPMSNNHSGGQLPQPNAAPDIAVDDIPDAVIVADGETGVIIDANAAAGELFECDPATLYGRPQTDLHPDGEEDAYRQAFSRGIAGERVNRLADGSPLFIETTSGEQIPVEINVQRIKNELRVAIVGVFREVSEQIEREQQLRKTTTRLETLLDALPMPAAVLDTDGIVTRWNPASKATFGYDAAEICGEPYSLFINEEEFEQVFNDVLAGHGVDGYTTTLRAADGSAIPVELYAQPLFDDGSVTGIIGAAVDVTDKREHEQQLSVLHRVLRHNLRNDLNAIMGWTTQLTADSEKEQKAINQIGQAVTRLVELSKDATEIRNDITGTTKQIEPVSIETVQAELTEQLAPTGTVTINNIAFPEQVTAPRRGIDAVSDSIGDFSCEKNAVTIHSDTDYLRIEIDTPGCVLPDGAQALIQKGKETELDHATDLTAAKALLTINGLGGSVVPADETAAETDAICVDLPRVDS